MIENKKYFISQINSSKANKMVSLYHYSNTGFKPAILNLGVFRKDNNLLVGVLQWGCSFQQNIRLDRYVKEPIKKEEYLELNRFCMAESEGRNSESQAISLGIKWIKKYRPNVKLLVSYSGRREGKYGYIYQATNWEYLGYFISPGFWSIDGHEKHLMSLWSAYNKHGKEGLSFHEDLCERYQDVRQTWTKQFIYIIRLDKNLTPASPLLPYPKEDTDFPIKVKEKIFKQNDEIYNNPIPIEIPFVEYYYEEDELLFSRAALRRRGEIENFQYKYILYNEYGEFENEYETFKNLCLENQLSYNGAYTALRHDKPYKRKYFKKLIKTDIIPSSIDINPIAYIDEVPFTSYAEIGRYVGLSRQAVHQARQRQAEFINDIEIQWN